MQGGRRLRPERGRAMNRRVLFLLAFLLLPVAAFARGGHGAHHPAPGKTVHVHDYYRKDGTHVQSYDRSAPRSKAGGELPSREAHAKSENSKTCLSGTTPTLCNHSLLTPDELAQAQSAERRENLKTCLTGTTSTLCDHSLLTPEEVEQVHTAETRETRESQSPSTPQPPSASSHQTGHDYTNSQGQRVPSPTWTEKPPAGASAKCRDGSYSSSRSRRLTCSHHGGVARWL
jgi:hypothetical protein